VYFLRNLFLYSGIDCGETSEYRHSHCAFLKQARRQFHPFKYTTGLMVSIWPWNIGVKLPNKVNNPEIKKIHTWLCVIEGQKFCGTTSWWNLELANVLLFVRLFNSLLPSLPGVLFYCPLYGTEFYADLLANLISVSFYK